MFCDFIKKNRVKHSEREKERMYLSVSPVNNDVTAAECPGRKLQVFISINKNT